MIRKLLLLVLLICTSTLYSETRDLPALYRQIDDAISHSPEYVAAHEQGIEATRIQLRQADTASEKYKYAFRLYEQYKAYLNDSALAYIQQCVSLAEQMGDANLRDRCRSLFAFQCSTVGMYTESLGILHDISTAHLDQESRVDYYKACMHVCGELGYYTRLQSMRDYYYRLQNEYRDSLYAIADHHSSTFLMNRISELNNIDKPEKARELSNQWVERTTPGTHEYAIACYYRWMVNQPGSDEATYWLAQSALCDVRNAIMDQASLLALAEKLNADGDLERSYRYIRFTWDCNNHFNTRMRSWQITPILNVIERNYQSSIEQNTRVLTYTMIALSILALLLLAALFFVHRRNAQLATARNALKTSNDELGEANRQLASQADQLSTLNVRLFTANSQLAESNKVKEEYIGRFMSLCSQYINKLDDYRKMVNKKMKNKELDELFRISRSTEFKEKELEELYENFDSVFLNLFPTFVDEFNALLQPETQVHPKEDNRLTTEIRIFALIRLGIEDSSKIAEFLHYSVNTIYNYRARIKNGAIDNREHFEQRVKELCLIR